MEGTLEIAYDKFDKYMPEDSEIQNEYYEILDGESTNNEKIDSLVEFIDIHADEDRLQSYLGEASIKELATYIIEKNA